MKHKKRGNLFKIINQYLVFFLLVAFVITCSLMLFVSILSNTLNIHLTNENLASAAKLTFINVIFLSFLYTLLDYIRRKFTVDLPVKRITEATEKMMSGDFSVRIKPINSPFADNSFNKIITCVNKMAKELSGVESLRNDFISNVSHELKTPLSVISNYGTLLQQPDLSHDKRLEYSKSITDTSRSLANLVTNILKLNKLENQQIFPTMEEYNLGEQLCECLLNFESQWETKNINITTDIDENITINSDAELLSLVWNNLFSNALKFTDCGGSVFVSLKSTKDLVTVKVKDSGCGMSSDVGAHIFEKFYQGDTSHATQGNGLGLALVKRVVDIIRGEIQVESILGAGSVFTVTLKKQERN